MTNADVIRSMSVSELADFIYEITQCCGTDSNCSMCPIFYGCSQNIMVLETWLEKEVDCK